MTNPSQEIGIALLGFGTVGSGVWKILNDTGDNGNLLEYRTGKKFRIKKVLVKDPKKKREVSVPSSVITTRFEDVLNDPSIQIVVELMGGIEPAASYILQAIKAGKRIVTANKALLAERGEEIFEAARRGSTTVGFEAAVAGGIPIVKAIREGLIGNRILEIYGIINGTSNFILSEMTEKGENFQDVLLRAQKEGYAESDPRFDIEGTDAAQKLAILISLSDGVRGVVPKADEIFVDGITRISALDIEYARKLGYAIKLLAICKQGVEKNTLEARVHPTMIPLGHPLADVRGVFNAIFLKGDAVGDMMFLGRGAGMMPTASAVVSDIAMAMAATGAVESASAPATSRSKAPKIISINDLCSEYYLRFSVVDQPGVLAQIAQVLGEEGISISGVYQRERDEGALVPIVVITHEAKESSVQKAIKKIDALKVSLDKTMLVRIQRFL